MAGAMVADGGRARSQAPWGSEQDHLESSIGLGQKVPCGSGGRTHFAGGSENPEQLEQSGIPGFPEHKEKLGIARNDTELCGRTRSSPEQPGQYGTVRNTTEQPGTVRNSTEQHGTIRNSPEQYGTVRNSTEGIRDLF
eukprot:gene25863-biopygen3029